MGVALTRYQDALDVLFARTTAGTKFGLERVLELSRLMGAPHEALRAFHVAGTNGKGSVVATLDALLRRKGLRVGRYTSPHLVDFRERIAVDGAEIPPDEVVAWIERWLPAIERIGATFFEATTVLAFDWFVRQRVDVAVVEVGLGGRLDATNVLRPLVAGVTTIGVDHVEYLGGTLEQIAREKAGIFKPGVPAVVGEPFAPIRDLLAGEARERGAEPVRVVARETEIASIELTAQGTRFTLGGALGQGTLTTPLTGRHQAINTSVALTMLDAAGEPYRVTLDEARAGLGDVRLPGRFQRVGGMIFDVAHNPDGAAVLARTLELVAPPRPLVVLLCVLGDKDWRGMMRALAPVADRFVLTQAPTAPASRSWDPGEAGRFAIRHGWDAEVEADFARALDRARALGEGAGGTTLVTGSFHTVGDALARLPVTPGAG